MDRKRRPRRRLDSQVNEDGSVTVHIGKIDMGTIPGFGIPMIVAEELGIPVSDVTVVNVDTDASPWDAGTVGSRGILVSGGATRLAAIDARTQIFKMAARKLEASPEDLEIVDKQIRVKARRRRRSRSPPSPPTRTTSSAKSSAAVTATIWN